MNEFTAMCIVVATIFVSGIVAIGVTEYFNSQKATAAIATGLQQCIIVKDNTTYVLWQKECTK